MRYPAEAKHHGEAGRFMLCTSDKIRKFAKWVCKKRGKAAMRPLGYRMEMALPLARGSSPVRY